jgi:hypothetical protein
MRLPANIDRMQNNRLFLAGILLALAILSAGIYLRVSPVFGFPIDDAWIHQVYARSLGTTGRLEFVPGELSAGSTSIAWSLLLAVEYGFGFNPIKWAYLWGVIFVAGSAFLASLFSYRLFGHVKYAWLVGIVTVLEWHLAWAAVSGMETTLFAFLSLVCFVLVDSETAPFGLGVIAGLLTLVRPEGLLLSGLICLKLIWRQSSKKESVLSIGYFALSFLILTFPFAAFNWRIGGDPLPGTVYAKFMQWGYPLRIENTLRYLLDTLLFFMRGPLMLLVPAAAIMIFQAISARNSRLVLPLLWSVCLIGLNAIAVPLLYDHGRYLMPLIPIVIVFGVEGLRRLSQQFNRLRLFWTAYAYLILVMIVALWINGASTYALGELLRQEKVSYLAVFSGYYQPLITELHASRVYSPPNVAELRALGIEPFEVYSLDLQN